MDAHKLAKVLAMAASDNDSEALHALRTARRLLEAQGVGDFVEVARRVADQQPAAIGTARAQVEDLEDAVFDLRNEIRNLRAENERLKRGLAAPVAAEPPVSFADAARDAAAAIRLRAELEEAERQMGESRAHEAQTREHLKHEMAENRRLAADLSEARARLAEMGAKLLAAEAQPQARKPAPRAKPVKRAASQYALL